MTLTAQMLPCVKPVATRLKRFPSLFDAAGGEFPGQRQNKTSICIVPSFRHRALGRGLFAASIVKRCCMRIV